VSCTAISVSISDQAKDRTDAAYVKVSNSEDAQLPIVDIEALPHLLGATSTLAGLDLGDKTIGLAVSDRSLAYAHPRPVILRKKFTLDAQALIAALDKEGVAAIAIGLPINMDGSEGPRAQTTRAFIRNLLKTRDFPVLFWDERLSTVAAERVLIEMDFSRKKRAGRIDSAAAAFILQGVLDRLRALR
jgi:putative Holliday junction resolvase